MESNEKEDSLVGRSKLSEIKQEIDIVNEINHNFEQVHTHIGNHWFTKNGAEIREWALDMSLP